MGQKVNPIGIRLKINREWDSKWYVGPRAYADTLHEDLRLRKQLLESPLTRGGEISQVEIIRHPQKISLIVHTARPGVVIGSKGENIEKISSMLQKDSKKKVQIKIREIKNPETNAQIISMMIARQLKQRPAFRRTLKMAVENAMKSNIQGVRVKISGRLGGAEMSRSIAMIRGRMPLHTLRADIDYGFAESMTTYGTIGVKTWIFRKEIFRKNTRDDAGLLIKKKNQSGQPRKAPEMGKAKSSQSVQAAENTAPPLKNTPDEPVAAAVPPVAPQTPPAAAEQPVAAEPPVADEAPAAAPPAADPQVVAADEPKKNETAAAPADTKTEKSPEETKD